MSHIATIFDSIPKRKGLVNKDVAGGYGTVGYFGEGFIPSLLTLSKRLTINYPPLLFGYIAAILKSNYYSVYLAKKIDDINPDSNLIIFNSSIVTCYHDIEQAKLIRKKLPNAHLVVMGSFVSSSPELYKDYFDTVIVGEAEKFFIDHLSKKILPKGIVNVGLIEDLNVLPFPDWSLWGNSFRYVTFLFKPGKGNSVLPILTSRGCTMSCAYYCPYTALTGRKWRKRNVENVLDEIEYLINKFSAKYLLFRDPIFTLDMKRAEQIALGIINRKLKIKYAIETHLSFLNKELIDVMVESGLHSINTGIESVNENIMDNFQRKHDEVEHQEEILNYCKKKNILLSGFYILGLPDDTKETVKQTISYAKKLNLDIAQFTVPTPYPGTPFYNDVLKSNLITDHNFENYDVQTVILKHKNLTANELRRLKNHAYSSYYRRPEWVLSFLRRMLLN